VSSIPKWLTDLVGEPATPWEEKRMRELADSFKSQRARTAAEKRDREMFCATAELERLTTDSAPVAMVRAAKVYLAAVQCVAAGGSVVFRAADGREWVLKVRLR
jgi:hypothetical protein